MKLSGTLIELSATEHRYATGSGVFTEQTREAMLELRDDDGARRGSIALADFAGSLGTRYRVSIEPDESVH